MSTTTEVTTEDVREFVGLFLAHNRAQHARRDPDSVMARRYDAQAIMLAEVLHFLDDDNYGTGADLRSRGLVPLTLDDLPTRLGGPPSNDDGM